MLDAGSAVIRVIRVKAGDNKETLPRTYKAV